MVSNFLNHQDNPGRFLKNCWFRCMEWDEWRTWSKNKDKWPIKPECIKL